MSDMFDPLSFAWIIFSWIDFAMYVVFVLFIRLYDNIEAYFITMSFTLGIKIFVR